MKVQIIEREGRPEWAVLPYDEYLRMLEQLEDLHDIQRYDAARAEVAAGEDELIPARVIERLAAGEPPVCVWREHRGLAQQTVATAAGITLHRLAALETTDAAAATPQELGALANALSLDVDDLKPWPQA